MLNQREFVVRETGEEKVMVSVETETLTLSYAKNLLFSLKALKYLNLSDGQLSQESFLALVVVLDHNQHLRCINVSNNLIYLDSPKVEYALTKFKELPSLRKVDLSLNYISKDAQAYLRESKKPSWSLFSIFKTKKYPYLISDGSAVHQDSVIAPQHLVSDRSWVISLLCKKGTSHAMVYMEGRCSKGQRFIEMSHLILPEGEELARVQVSEIDPKYFDPEKYYSQSFTINKEQGEKFRSEVQKNQMRGVLYCSYWSGVDYAYVNCIDWCLKELRKIGIHIDKTLIPTAGNVVSGSSCSIM